MIKILEKWISGYGRWRRFLRTTEKQKVSLSSYQPQRSAYDWLLIEKRRVKCNPKEVVQPYIWKKFTRISIFIRRQEPSWSGILLGWTKRETNHIEV